MPCAKHARRASRDAGTQARSSVVFHCAPDVEITKIASKTLTELADTVCESCARPGACRAKGLASAHPRASHACPKPLKLGGTVSTSDRSIVGCPSCRGRNMRNQRALDCHDRAESNAPRFLQFGARFRVMRVFSQTQTLNLRFLAGSKLV